MDLYISLSRSQLSGSQERGDKEFHNTEDFTWQGVYNERRNTRNYIYIWCLKTDRKHGAEHNINRQN